jgi:predicted negative regulator of RcsB-dependent stress response
VDDHLNDKEQVELVKSWLRENGPWLVAGVVIGAAALWGYNAWQQRKESIAVQASGKYDEIVQALQRKDSARGVTLADELRRDFSSSPYVDQADLAVARAMVESDKLPQAAERLTRVMNESKDEELRLLARLRLARVQLEQGNADQAAGTLGGAEPGAFAPRFDEARGDILLAKGDKVGALREYAKARGTSIAGVIDTATLDLKIADLRAQGLTLPQRAASAAATTMPPVAAPAKP